MKNLRAVFALLIAVTSTQALALVPHSKPAQAVVTSSSIYLQDINKLYWRAETDCNYSITANSDVSIAPLNMRAFGPISPRRAIKVNSRLLVTVDQQEHVCRVTSLRAMK